MRGCLPSEAPPEVHRLSVLVTANPSPVPPFASLVNVRSGSIVAAALSPPRPSTPATDQQNLRNLPLALYPPTGEQLPFQFLLDCDA